MECIICLETITEPSASTPCCRKILYHSECGQKWLDKIFLNPTCPWCKTPVEDSENNVRLRSYQKLKHLVMKNKWCGGHFNLIIDKENEWKDEKGYFEIFHYQQENKEDQESPPHKKNVFHIIFKNKVHLVYWFSQKNCLFSYASYKNILSNQELGMEKYQGNNLVAEVYFEMCA